jgi:hypothetical protein
MKRRTKRILIGVKISILVVAVVVILSLIILLYPIWHNPFNDRTFEEEIWHAYHNSLDSDNPRGNMADDLRKNHLRRGMTKEQVIELLGEPDFEKSSKVLKYNLGMWSGIGFDYDSLDIYFDSAGSLTETRIVQH